MVEMRLYVEGGGDARALRTACRRGFSEFLVKAGLKNHMPRIVACGGRRQAYDDFCTALKQGQHAMLLVDSESAVSSGSPWTHLREREGDRWPIPPDATEDACHLMVQCMESWFLTDRDTLSVFFGQGFNPGALPYPSRSVEQISKGEVFAGLAAATRGCKTKASYRKGDHSFDLLARIDPAKVTAGSAWAARFTQALKERMGC